MSRRIVDLDAVRGFALAGLPMVNLGLTFGASRYPRPDGISAVIYHHFIFQHFLTIFCFLFGASFALVLDAAAERGAPRPRAALARRMVVLAAFGAVQASALDGNLQLAIYAALGLLLLLPLSYLPRTAVLVIGAVLVIASMPMTELDPEHAGNPVKVLLEWGGLVLLGASFVRFGLHRALPALGRPIRRIFFGSAVLAVVVTLMWTPTTIWPGAMWAEVGLLSTCTAYVTALLMVLRTPLRRPLVAVLTPLGRMAISCFLSQAAVAVALAAFLDLHDVSYPLLNFAGVAAFVGAQSLVCAWWLRRHRYGPVEWLWRCATWLTVVPMRRPAPAGVPERSGARSLVEETVSGGRGGTYSANAAAGSSSSTPSAVERASSARPRRRCSMW